LEVKKVTAIHETAYPRIRSNVTDKELVELYTPTEEQLLFADENAQAPVQKLGLLVLLKSFQRLGYFPMLREIPPRVIRHIAGAASLDDAVLSLENYEKVGSRRRHTPKIRRLLGINDFRTGGEQVMNEAMRDACQTKDIIADIINFSIEELVRQRYELPGFTTLLRTAQKIRFEVNSTFYQKVSQSLSDEQQELISNLLQRSEEDAFSDWNRLKQEARRPTTKNIREFIEHLHWLKSLNVGSNSLEQVPEVKLQRFSEEAKSLNAAQMKEMNQHKRLTLAVALIQTQTAAAIDDLAEMFIRSVGRLHNHGHDALEAYHQAHREKTDRLIEILFRMVGVVNSPQQAEEQMDMIRKILGDDVEAIAEECEAYLGYAGNNYLPFLPKLYRSQRRNFFRCLEIFQPQSTSSDKALEEALMFLLKHQSSRAQRLKIMVDEEKRLDLSWIPPKWWKMVTGTANRDLEVDSVDRRYFEICLFSCMMLELKSGDLFIEGSDKFGDYRQQLISWEEYRESVDTYCQQVCLPTNPDEFVSQLKEKLTSTIISVDSSFPQNEYVSIKNGEPVVRKHPKRETPEGLSLIKQLLEQHLPKYNIIDVLSDTEHWLNWTRHFRPVSGYESRLDFPQPRYITTTFCYGCNLGPVQTAQSLENFDRRQVAYVNQRHINEDKLLNANVQVINEYNQFDLPKRWGSGKSALADGTKWDVYEQNLLSEYHIRYGGWGGIGYYHVSDTYIALFSSFISCGVWEAIYILDGLLENKSDIRPDTLHADTQGQSEPVFGLANLLKIKLMPRIRNWKDLTFYLSDEELKISHIQQLFSDTIDWKRLYNHFHDMLRVAISISKGKIRSSTILRKLGTYSRKNKLYLAFRELGRVNRTEFLLNYIAIMELRRFIDTATNKSESWNKFIQWVSFGGHEIRQNNREEQRKFIRYNHLVANLVIFHNVVNMTRVIKKLIDDGYTVTEEILSRLSPYATGHINRFGTYRLQFDRIPPPIVTELEL
jgi:TnpA family transposase